MASSSKPENWLLFLVYSHRCPSSKINGWPKNWLIASVSYGIHWPRTQERLSMTPSSVGQAFVQNSMTTLGSYFAIGSIRCVQCHLATSAWNFAYSPSASWTHLSLRKDQSLITSKWRWCSSLQKWCPWNSISACGAALDPSLSVAFLALLAASFFEAICETKKKAKQTPIS